MNILEFYNLAKENMIYDNNKESDGDSNLVKIFAAELFSWIQENKQILDNNPALKNKVNEFVNSNLEIEELFSYFSKINKITDLERLK